jgi:hypothetical protein
MTDFSKEWAQLLDAGDILDTLVKVRGIPFASLTTALGIVSSACIMLDRSSEAAKNAKTTDDVKKILYLNELLGQHLIALNDSLIAAYETKALATEGIKAAQHFLDRAQAAGQSIADKLNKEDGRADER